MDLDCSTGRPGRYWPNRCHRRRRIDGRCRRDRAGRFSIDSGRPNRRYRTDRLGIDSGRPNRTDGCRPDRIDRTDRPDGFGIDSGGSNRPNRTDGYRLDRIDRTER